MWKFFITVFYIFYGFLQSCNVMSSQHPYFLRCHDDPGYMPQEGPLKYIQFTWLGTLQYIHIKKGTPHYFRVPRVVLISRQYVLATAADASEVPDGFALGNIAFGEYERDESECGLTLRAINSGEECPLTAVLTPVADVLVHPHYKQRDNFNIDSISSNIAILKLLVKIHSRYMVPVCLPFNNYLTSRSQKEIKDNFFLIDFESDVPRDIVEEDKEVTKLSLLPKEVCYLYNGEENATVPNMDKIMCTAGCGFHIGAASIFHEHTGHWTLLALSLGGPPCPDPLRSGKSYPSAHHLLIHPYVPWITAAITGKDLRGINKDDPFGYSFRTSFPQEELFGHDWNGHWWQGGLSCYLRGEAADMLFKFYNEFFQVKPIENMNLTYYLEIHAAHGSAVTCVKIGLPFQISRPTIWGLDSPHTKVRIPVLNIKSMYRFQVEAFAFNVTKDSSSESEESEEEENKE